MASYAVPIANAIATAITGVSGAPTVAVRKQDALHASELTSAYCIVSVEREAAESRAFEGSILKQYWLIVSLYRKLAPTVGDIGSNLDSNPALVLSIKQACDLTALSGVSVVYDVDLVDAAEWEQQPFGVGVEVSRFGLVVRTSEPRNG